MERAIPTSDIFSPSREVGMASYHISDDLNKTLALGVFFDDIPESTKEVIDDNQGLRLSARATWLPYYDEPSNGRYLIHSGLGFVHTDPRDDLIRFRARGGEYRETQRLIDSGNIAANSYSVANLELATVTGPLSFQSELYATAVDRISATDVTLYGAYVQASYFLTGENRRYNRDGRHLAHFGRVRPLTNFFLVPGGAGWGAWEAKARWSYLDFGALDRGRYNEMTVGMNWHWTEHAQVMLEWTRPWTSAEATVGNTVIGATEADLLAFRLQFTF
jgi:phosphate-selective porin OprO/OprP